MLALDFGKLIGLRLGLGLARSITLRASYRFRVYDETPSQIGRNNPIVVFPYP